MAQHASLGRARHVWYALRAVVGFVVARVRTVRERVCARRLHPVVLYADGVVRVDPDGLTVRRYYWPRGRKRIPFDTIREYRTHALTMGHGQYRVHGIDRRGRWYSRDRRRQDKPLAIVLDVGRRIRPVLTPADPQAVLSILDQRRHASSTEV